MNVKLKLFSNWIVVIIPMLLLSACGGSDSGEHSENAHDGSIESAGVQNEFPEDNLSGISPSNDYMASRLNLYSALDDLENSDGSDFVENALAMMQLRNQMIEQKSLDRWLLVSVLDQGVSNLVVKKLNQSSLSLNQAKAVLDAIDSRFYDSDSLANLLRVKFKSGGDRETQKFADLNNALIRTYGDVYSAPSLDWVGGVNVVEAVYKIYDGRKNVVIALLYLDFLSRGGQYTDDRLELEKRINSKISDMLDEKLMPEQSGIGVSKVYPSEVAKLVVSISEGDIR